MIRKNEILYIGNETDEIVIESMIRSVAEEHLGSTALGASTLGYLRVLKRLQNRPGRMPFEYKVDAAAGPILTPSLLVWGAAQWEHTGGPFDAKSAGPYGPALTYDGRLQDARSKYHHHWSIMAGGLVKHRLANFLTEKGFDQHQLRGTMGRVYDTLAITSGVLEEPRTPELEAAGDPLEFISLARLRQEMDDANLSRYARNFIRDSIHSNVRAQMATGQPVPVGETVLGGYVDFRGEASFTARADSIAVQSLAPLAVTIPGEKAQPAQDFLARFG